MLTAEKRSTREQQLIEATRQVISSEGYSRTTMARVGRRAGLSVGTVQHYFWDKEGLLAATLASLNKELSDATITRLKIAQTPLDRLYAIADIQFADEQFTPDRVAVWHSLWGNLRDSSRLTRLQGIYVRRMRSNVRHAMRQIVPITSVDDQTDAMLAMIYGLWIKAAQPPDQMTAKDARRLMQRYLDLHVVLPFASVDNPGDNRE